MSSSDITEWTGKWFTSIESGKYTMSQRKLSVLKSKGGGLKAIKKEAVMRGIHLLQITDDKGVQLVAASKTPFKIIC